VTRKSDIPSVLVVAGDMENRRLLRVTLEKGGFNILLADTGDEGIAQAVLNTPDLILLDIDNLVEDPFAVLHQLHRCVKSSVIVLSARESEQDIVRSLESGADDYIVKPFRTGELIARVRVSLRRHYGEEDESPLTLGSITVDFRARIVWKGNEQARLTRTEYALFLLLIRNAGKVLTHRYILEQVWGVDCTEETEYLRVYVGHLRRKLGDGPAPQGLISTASGIGYGWGLGPGSGKPVEGRRLPSPQNLRHPPGIITP
jgi:two-component system KDP operon response regulator KdpE